MPFRLLNVLLMFECLLYLFVFFKVVCSCCINNIDVIIDVLLIMNKVGVVVVVIDDKISSEEKF